MFFELDVALKYLIPRRKALSTALIAILSSFVISLVIWLVLVFLSVTNGMEKNWLKKLTSIYAPIRITPTESYYSSYYYLIDSIASESNFSLKTIGEKRTSPLSDPYSPDSDLEIPTKWASPDRKEGKLLDPVKLAFQELRTIPAVHFDDYEVSGALLKICLRNGTSLSQMTYLLSIADENPNLKGLIIDALPSPLEMGVYLPKSYKDGGVVSGDIGILSFSAPTAASFQEQQIEVQVAGFYDPGILAMGNKCLLVPNAITRTISASIQMISPDGAPTNGIFVWTKDLKEAGKVALQIEKAFSKSGIGSYWKVDTYEDFEFSKDLLIQFQSDRMLLLFIAAIILIVACSNIISLLVLLVNNKKREIAILQSMGASSQSIASIFAICGLVLGTIGCLVGSAAAYFTLKYLDPLMTFFSFVQGKKLLNPAFFGNALPNELSADALIFVLIATPILSIAAALIPSFKASRIVPAQVLRSE